MTTDMALLSVSPTAFLAGPESALRQLFRVTIDNPGEAAAAELAAQTGSILVRADLGRVPSGETTHDLFLDAVDRPGETEVVLLVEGAPAGRVVVARRPPRKWRVHLVQRSHHDVGYTNLPSAVLREHDIFLETAIELAEATAGYPEESQFRVVVEQAWSIAHFLRHAPPERAERLLALVRSGHVELTALFGNLVTELCGPETLARALYHSRQIARRAGVPIVSAEHNDVPGMSWGLAQVLADAGIRIFCAGLPRYWNWCQPAMQSFWDDAALFPGGQPGGFWWEAPSGARVLLWDDAGAGGDVRPALPGLADRLQALEEKGYLYEAVRWPVRGGARDNSPYVGGYSQTAREWNARWTYPRLIVSTNARFYADVSRELPEDLPVFRGELPGQDYPTGSASTAEATAVNRENHARLLSSERLAAAAAEATDYAYQDADLSQAYEDVLWYDEHTWGHHFPCGPSSRASELEKCVHAHRAAALAHDVTSKALARIADHVRLPGDGLHLVVFNPLPQPRTGPVSTPMREIDNCGSTMAPVSPADDSGGGGYLRGVPLTDRWHTNTPSELLDGAFDLVDLDTGQPLPFQIHLLDAEEPAPYAPQRAGLGLGGRRYGMMEPPQGIGRDLRFLARDVPACGYKTYQLVPRPGAVHVSSPHTGGGR